MENIIFFTCDSMNHGACKQIVTQFVLEKWNRALLKHYTFVAVENEVIVGFGDIDKTVYLERLFVHKEHQGKGIATEYFYINFVS